VIVVLVLSGRPGGLCWRVHVMGTLLLLRDEPELQDQNAGCERAEPSKHQGED
jgi:hypothetical protein